MFGDMPSDYCDHPADKIKEGRCWCGKTMETVMKSNGIPKGDRAVLFSRIASLEAEVRELKQHLRSIFSEMSESAAERFNRMDDDEDDEDDELDDEIEEEEEEDDERQYALMSEFVGYKPGTKSKKKPPLFYCCDAEEWIADGEDAHLILCNTLEKMQRINSYPPLPKGYGLPRIVEYP